jgi:enoyl-CoA hydratase
MTDSPVACSAFITQESTMSQTHSPPFTKILTERRGSTFIITLNRPEVRNALDHVIEREIYDALDIAQADDDVAVVLLEGAGEVFSAGHDHKQEALDWETGDPPLVDGEPWHLTTTLLPSWRFDKPLLAAVHGYVGPHANAILMTCDYVFAARGTRFSFEAARIGVGAPWGPYVLLYLYFPMRVIQKIWSAGGWMDADQALQLHYVQRVVEPGEVEAEALKWAAHLASMDPGALRASKRGIRDVYEATGLQQMLQIGKEVYMNPEFAVPYLEQIKDHGVAQAVRLRDQGTDPELTRL